MNLYTQLQGITQSHFETLFSCARGKASPIQGIQALEEIKEQFIGFSGAYRSTQVEPAMHRTYVSLSNNFNKALAQVEQCVHDMQVTTPHPESESIEAAITNMQLLVNSLRQVARTIDRTTAVK